MQSRHGQSPETCTLETKTIHLTERPPNFRKLPALHSLHLHSIKDLEQKVKISNPYKLPVKCWEQLKCSCSCKVGAFPPPYVAEVLALRPQVINHRDLFSCQYIQKVTPKLNNGVFNKPLKLGQI